MREGYEKRKSVGKLIVIIVKMIPRSMARSVEGETMMKIMKKEIVKRVGAGEASAVRTMKIARGGGLTRRIQRTRTISPLEKRN